MRDLLFSPLDVGTLSLPNRVLLAPLTRNRAGEDNVPGELNARYYQQRASAGLIISEATQVAPQGQGYPRTPGIHSDAQVVGWKKVTDAVHRAGGRIFLQLWHVGRISHSSYHNGALPVAPSAIRPDGQALTPGMEQVPFETPRALELDEIPEVVAQYRHGAEQAQAAGFDGVEIHAANGYLIDQFLRSGTNKRTDRYGGSLENRARFLREVTEAVVGVWGAGRTGIRFSPLGTASDMSDEDPEATFGRAAEVADTFGLAYVHLVEPGQPKPPVKDDGLAGAVFSRIRKAFEGPLVANGNYDRETAEEALRGGYAEAIAFGRLFLANPDLPRRLEEGLPINVPDEASFYGGAEEGYTDYPTWDEDQANGKETETVASAAEVEARDS